MRHVFKVDPGKFKKADENCVGTPCEDCYIEELWREIGDSGCGHCSKTREAFNNVFTMPLKELPDKDSYVILKLKSGKTVHARLFYDEERNAGMYYDDFDNWYSLQDVDAVFQSPLNKHVIIAVEYP